MDRFDRSSSFELVHWVFIEELKLNEFFGVGLFVVSFGDGEGFIFSLVDGYLVFDIVEVRDSFFFLE